MTPEGRVKTAIKAVIAAVQEKEPVYVNWPVPVGYGESTLDCIGCHRGRFFAIEAKAPGKKPTPRQVFIAERMQEAGATVFVIDGMKGCMELWAWLTRSF